MKTIKKVESLLSHEACQALKERFGNRWRKAWLAWQKPSGTWMVTKVEFLTADHDIPANSGDMFCLGIKKPTQADLMGLMAHGTRPTPTYTAAELMKAFGVGETRQ